MITMIWTVRLDARTVVKVSEDAKPSVISREGAPGPKNGLVTFDTSDPPDGAPAISRGGWFTGGVRGAEDRTSWLTGLGLRAAFRLAF